MNNDKTRVLRAIWAAVAAAALAGCGGGGGDAVTGAPSTASTSASGTVSSSGGTVSTADGVAAVAFPAGAFSTTTTVSIAPSASAPASPRLVSGTAFDFGPSGTFAQPVQLTLKYMPAALPAGALESRLVLYSASGGSWTPVAGSSVNTTTHTVTAPITHFSTYGILADNQFAGSYSGTYAGSTFGAWLASVDTSGRLIATASGGFAGNGAVAFNGTSTIPLTGSGTSQGFTVTFGGNFTLQPDGTHVVAGGTWSSSSGQAGTWTGSKN